MTEFYIFAVVVTSEGSVGKRKLKAFTPYFLCDGWHFDGSKIIRSKKKMLYKSPYNEYLQSKNGLSLSISAIAGENGSGKSSLVEFIIRLINNFATSIFGEQNMTLAFEHLHYIDGVEGRLYFSIDGIPHMVSVENRSVTLESFSLQQENKDEQQFFAYTTPNIFDNEQPKVPVEDTTPISEWKDRKGDDKSIKEKLSKFFFYTLVNNYSIYAYNSSQIHILGNTHMITEDSFEWVLTNDGKMFLQQIGLLAPVLQNKPISIRSQSLMKC